MPEHTSMVRQCVFVGAGLTALFCSSCSSVPLPSGVAVRTEQVTLTGEAVMVDFYVPQGVAQAPVVVVAHGFMRHRASMAGWGRLLATNGFIAAVLDQPAWSDYRRNGRAIAELLALVQSGTLISTPKPATHGALVGFSRGGLTTLLAAADTANVHCWVGLDPVAAGQPGEAAAAALRIPCVVLRAAPAPWNAHGDARRIIAALSGPVFALRVNQATHCDAEDPTDWLAEWACGGTDPARRAVFQRYTVAALRAAFFGDGPSLATLRAAESDPGVSEVEARQVARFRPPR
jgi:dienelactone hydrolase